MKEYKKNKVKIKDGAVITGYKGEYIFEIINDTKDYYESIILNEWVKKIGKPEVIFDIGANIGNHTVFFAKHTDALKIYSFEPYKINFERLNDNVKDNGYMGKVELYNTAVGEKKGKLILKNIDERNLGSATFDYSNNSEGDFSVIRLDDFVKEKKIEKLDFVKIDTEGFEESVIKGMLKSLIKFNPVLWIEVSFDSFKNVNKLLSNQGYVLSDMQGCNLLYKNTVRFPESKSVALDSTVEKMLLYYDKSNKYYSHYETAKQWVNNKNKIIENKEKDLNAAYKKIIGIQEDLNDKQNKIVELLDENQKLENENFKHEEKITREFHIKETLRDDYLSLSEKAGKLETEKEELIKKLETEKIFSETIEKNFSTLNSLIDKKDVQIHLMEKQIERISNELENKETHNKMLEDKESALKEMIDLLKKQCETAEGSSEKLQEILKEKEEELGDLKKEIEQSYIPDDELKALKEELRITKAGVETRNKRIKIAEEKFNAQLKQNEVLKKLFEEYNTLLYQSKKLNAAYERFPDIKFYNWARKLKNRHRESKNIIEEVVDNVQATTGQEQKVSVTQAVKEDATVKYDMLFSEFADKGNTSEKDKKKFILRDGCTSLKELKVACIMDEFTFSCFAPECNLLQLTPKKWYDEMKKFAPDMLFVESAWLGKEGEWQGMIIKTKPEFCSLTEYCRDNDIPVVFWNKEDPVHNEGFMAAAGLCDFVFTTEVDCITQYKRSLGHDKVYMLHFAAQPKLHNPIETFERKDKFCFAGAYYENYPERTKVFNNLAHYAMRKKDLDIYDRNYNKPEADHQFPEYYKPFIIGNLESEEIDKAYKGYVYNINANSGTWTQTMFARRVFELMASNTIVVGNFSRGLRTLFGDMTVTTDNIDETAKCLERYCSDDSDMHRYRLQGHRKVSQEDLYEDRLDYIVQKVFEISLKRKLPEVMIVSVVKDDKQLEKIKEMVRVQTYSNVKLFIEAAYDYDGTDEDILPKGVSIEEFIKSNIKDSFVAYFDVKDFYGENYILDMMLMLRYGEYDAVGKSSYYNREGKLIVDEEPYHNVYSFSIRRSVFSYDIAKNIEIKDTTKINASGLSMVSIHEFDYVENGDELTDSSSAKVNITDRGIAYKEIEKKAETIKSDSRDTGYLIDLENFFKTGSYGGKVDISDKNGNIVVTSRLDEGKHMYIYAKEVIRADVNIDASMWLIFEGQTGADVMLAVICHDENMKVLGTVYASSGLSKKAEFPANTKYIKLALRVKGPGQIRVSRLKINKSEINCRKLFLSKSNVLILTNIYPAYDDLYRNAFVHQRVKEYKKNGLNVDVMCFNSMNRCGYREFEGIDVINGFQDELEEILESGSINTVCVHFLDRYMWEILKKFKDKIRILVWCHGSEIQPWWRREFNYDSNEELEQAKILSEERMTFWNNVFGNIEDYNIHFIFVSNYFKDEVFEDYNLNLSSKMYSIIHNYINTDLFKYLPKPKDARKNILSIRPFASNKYANDLTVKCIKTLSKKDYFKELQFHIIGRGVLFESLMEELSDFKNVIAENRFLNQDEIAKLHKENGIFLVPTRMDSQGVSRDEAMSSGLVPVTNAVTAIPEFVDDSCGILAPGEDYLKMAEGIDSLYRDSEKFLIMSEAAATKVRKLSSEKFTIIREMEIINDKNKYFR